VRVVPTPAHDVPIVSVEAVAPSAGHGFGLFSGGRRKQLEAEQVRLLAEAEQLRAANDRLRTENVRLLGADPTQIRAEADAMRADLAGIHQQRGTVQQTLASLGEQIETTRGKLVRTEELALLQEVG
jgi:hypothetical protein